MALKALRRISVRLYGMVRALPVQALAWSSRLFFAYWVPCGVDINDVANDYVDVFTATQGCSGWPLGSSQPTAEGDFSVGRFSGGALRESASPAYLCGAVIETSCSCPNRNQHICEALPFCFILFAGEGDGAWLRYCMKLLYVRYPNSCVVVFALRTIRHCCCDIILRLFDVDSRGAAVRGVDRDPNCPHSPTRRCYFVLVLVSG